MVSVRLDQVGYIYPGSEEAALSGLSLEIHDGEAHALLGASGAGKTTMLNLLSGLLHPTEGEVYLGDRNVSLLGARERNVALVFQFPVLYESKSVLENLMFPLDTRGWRRAEAQRRAEEIASELGIDAVLSLKPQALSLFQKQLTAIGKSLVRPDVDLVLLDEPLTAVEPGIKWRLRQTLSRFQETHGLTMIYVTHDQTEALTFADVVSVMADGGIVQTGTPEDIYESPASKLVGRFIGSPGMNFVDCEVRGGEILVAGSSLGGSSGLADGAYELGVRSEWARVSDQAEGDWRVVDSKILGTTSGEVRRLVRLSSEIGHLQVETTGRLPDDGAVNVSFEKFVMFDGEGAVYG